MTADPTSNPDPKSSSICSLRPAALQLCSSVLLPCSFLLPLIGAPSASSARVHSPTYTHTHFHPGHSHVHLEILATSPRLMRTVRYSLLLVLSILGSILLLARHISLDEREGGHPETRASSFRHSSLSSGSGPDDNESTRGTDLLAGILQPLYDRPAHADSGSGSGSGVARVPGGCGTKTTRTRKETMTRVSTITVPNRRPASCGMISPFPTPSGSGRGQRRRTGDLEAGAAERVTGGWTPKARSLASGIISEMTRGTLPRVLLEGECGCGCSVGFGFGFGFAVRLLATMYC